MATAEGMASSIRIEGQGVFALLWDAKEDLVRALMVLDAALAEVPKQSLLLTSGETAIAALRQLVETRDIIVGDGLGTEEQCPAQPAHEIWFLFLQQAASDVMGPWLNGWRRPVRQSPGSVLFIRHADFEPFQRRAPDLASFIGPRIYNASTMLSVVSDAVQSRLEPGLCGSLAEIITALPGRDPDERELRGWIEACERMN